jgi:hypothetical protein
MLLWTSGVAKSERMIPLEKKKKHLVASRSLCALSKDMRLCPQESISTKRKMERHVVSSQNHENHAATQPIVAVKPDLEN